MRSLAIGVAVPSPPQPAKINFAPGEVVFGYRLIRKLGSGNFGTVWLGTNDKNFDRALKFVDLDRKGGKKEFKALQLISEHKICSGDLLQIIDYAWLAEDGTSLSTMPVSTGSKVAGKPQPGGSHPAAPRGTLAPSGHFATNDDDDAESGLVPASFGVDTNRARWLVVVTEVGDRTLHDLQVDETKQELTRTTGRQWKAVTRCGSTTSGSRGPRTPAATKVDSEDELLVPLLPSKVLPFMAQAARGLDYLHGNNIVHRDVKPQNILLVGSYAKLCDYGLVSKSSKLGVTTPGFTLAYAAPEAINSRAVAASDQYSLAVTYIELVTGRWPFHTIELTAICAEKAAGRHNLEFIPKVKVRQVLERALANDPVARWKSCVKFVEELAAAERVKPRGVSAPALALSALAVVFVFVLGLGLLFPERARRIAEALAIVAPRESVTTGTDAPATHEQTPVAPAVPTSPAGDASNPPPKPKPPVVEVRRIPLIEPTPLAPVPPAPPKFDPAAELEKLFAEQNAQPDDFLARFVELVKKVAEPDKWWSQLHRRAEADPDWLTAIEDWLLESQLRSSVDASAALSEVPGYDKFQSAFLDLSWNSLFANEAATVEAVNAVLHSPALQLHQAEYRGRILRVDLELRQQRLLVQPPDNARLSNWEVIALQPTEADLKAELDNPVARQFRMFVRAQLRGLRGKPNDWQQVGEDLRDVLRDKELPHWLDASRAASAKNLLGFAALAELRCKAADVPQFHRLRLSEDHKLTSLLEIAKQHGWESPPLAAVRAIVGATVASPNWQQIQQDLNVALPDSETSQLLAQRDQLLLLEYIDARCRVAQLPDRNAPPAELVEQFAGILFSSDQKNVARYFHFGGASNPELDEGVARNLLLPLLKDASVSERATGQAVTFADRQLAMLWGSLGRLLHRSNTVALIWETPLPGPNDTASQALLRANAAFEMAQRLDPVVNVQVAEAAKQVPTSLDYVVGYGRTLVELPGSSGEYAERDKGVIKLVNQLPPALTSVGSNKNVGLLTLLGYVRRVESYYDPSKWSDRMKLADEAQACYQAALKLTSATDDPFQVRPICLVGLSVLFQQHSGWLELSEADYRGTADLPTEPPASSKSYYLWHAIRFANEAIKIEYRSQPENAYQALAAAHEQMAMRLLLPKNYEDAILAYQDAIEAAKPGQRSTLKLDLAIGRLHHRCATDPNVNVDSIEREAHYRSAHHHLTAAIETIPAATDRVNKLQCDLEAYYLRARVRFTLARSPSEEETPQQWLADANSDLQMALKLGKELKSAIVGTCYTTLLSQARSQNDHQRGKQLIEECFQLAKVTPALFSSQNIHDLNIATPLHYGAGQPANHKLDPELWQRWFPTSGPLQRQLESSNDWKLLGVKGYLGIAYGETRNPAFLASAQRLADSIEGDDRLKNRALSLLRYEECAEAYKEYIQTFVRLKPGASPPMEVPRLQQEQKESFSKLLKAIGAHQAAVLASADPQTRALVNKINGTPLQKLPALQAELRPLEKQVLWEFCTRNMTTEMRSQFCAMYVGVKTGPHRDNLQFKRLAHDAAKPVFLFRNRTDDTHLKKVIELERGLLELETALGL